MRLAGVPARVPVNRVRMKRNPEISCDELREQLTRAAHDAYGPARAEELADQIGHLSQMMANIARHDLELTAYPLTAPVRDDRSER
jgi:hypothetical protein